MSRTARSNREPYETEKPFMSRTARSNRQPYEAEEPFIRARKKKDLDFVVYRGCHELLDLDAAVACLQQETVYNYIQIYVTYVTSSLYVIIYCLCI